MGRLDHYQKRVDWFPEIIQGCRLAGANFVWHIYGAGAAEQELREAIQERDCAGLVQFHGWLESGELAARASRHDVYFSCSRFEGLPVAMLEAMFCGLHCVVPNLPGGIRYVVENGGVQGYEANRAADGVRALLRAAAQQGVMGELKRNSRRMAHELFGLGLVEEQYVKLEKALAGLTFNGRVEDLARGRRVRVVPWLTWIKRRMLLKTSADLAAAGARERLRRIWAGHG